MRGRQAGRATNMASRRQIEHRLADLNKAAAISDGGAAWEPGMLLDKGVIDIRARAG
jgi:hypothetical protein